MKARKEDKKKWGIYVIYNKTTDKKYVGKSKNIRRRITKHVSKLNLKSKDENRYLTNAWHKYGRQDFNYFVIEYIDNKCLDNLAKQELYWMEHFNTLDRKFGYNLRKDSSSNMITHEETRKLMSKSRKKRYKDNPELRIEIGERSSRFWKNNPDIKKEMAESVSRAKTNYIIVQFDKDFNLVQEFPTQKVLKEELTDFYLPAILNVCNGNKSSYKGFYWRYKCVKTGKIREVKRPQGIQPKIKVINKLTKEEFIYDSVVSAAKNTDLTSSQIYHRLQNNKTLLSDIYQYTKI